MEDLKSFQEFFDYKPCNEENPTDILENILRKARKYLKPEEIDDLTSYKVAREIKDKIEETMQYPGTIKVVVIRETRAEEVAK